MTLRPGMRKGRRILVITLLTCLACLGFAPAQGDLGGTPSAAALVPVRLANLGVGLASMPQALAIERGIFTRNGIDLRVINFVNGGAEATAGVASGQVDIGSYGTPILIGLAFGLPIKIVASPPVKVTGFELVAKPEIHSVKDLKGQVVTSGALGGGSHQALLKILQSNGLSDSEVKIVAAGGADAEMVLRSGRVAAVVTSEPTRRKLEDDGRGRLIAKASDYYGRHQHGFIFATNAFIAKHPDSVRAYLRATRESLQYAQTHLDELVDFSAARIRLKKDIIRAYFEEQFKVWDLSFQVDVEGTANAVQVLKELKEIKATAVFDPNTWLDTRFLN
ncbi:ABC transporter substrate-binding protein [uncultured Thiodictyon sp.]|uniref:ABC transporter substrate-binding protein n=1 Tax=uncultured Thiodictyon sp. TaxID=1846217 RepID=UPI0025CC459D|nr:ABC transporter substrate-binding protein [uncultured Thiodictyon sp.]